MFVRTFIRLVPLRSVSVGYGVNRDPVESPPPPPPPWCERGAGGDRFPVDLVFFIMSLRWVFFLLYLCGPAGGSGRFALPWSVSLFHDGVVLSVSMVSQMTLPFVRVGVCVFSCVVWPGGEAQSARAEHSAAAAARRVRRRNL